MDIVTIIIYFVLGLFIARQHSQLTALVDIMKDLQRDLAAQKTRLDAQNAAIKELTGWNSELSERLNNARSRDAEILQNLRDAVTNQIKTDNRVTEIERYYVTYVARKKVEDDGDQIQEKPVSDE